MYNCIKCGNPFELGTKYCPKCGCNLEESFIINPVCPICGRTYPDGTQFCEDDGAKLVSPAKLIPKCVICGTEYSNETKFCPKDGGRVIAEALRYQNLHRYNPENLLENNTHIKAPVINRFIAAIIDNLICLAFSIPAITLYIIGTTKIRYHISGDDYSDAIIFFVLAFVCSFMPIIYSLIKDGLGNGQSWGKKFLGLKVIKIGTTDKCTKGISCLRTITTFLLNIIPFIGFLIEPIMIIMTSDGRRLADKVAGTIVVNAN